MPEKVRAFRPCRPVVHRPNREGQAALDLLLDDPLPDEEDPDEEDPEDEEPAEEEPESDEDEEDEEAEAVDSLLAATVLLLVERLSLL